VFSPQLTPILGDPIDRQKLSFDHTMQKGAMMSVPQNNDKYQLSGGLIRPKSKSSFGD
jgi:hypothetical protein